MVTAGSTIVPTTIPMAMDCLAPMTNWTGPVAPVLMPVPGAGSARLKTFWTWTEMAACRHLYADINAASSIMTGPGDRVQVHAGTYGDIDGDGTVEQIATIARSGCAQDQDAVATVLHCSSCSGDGDRRFLVAAGDPGARDEVIIDLGHTVATAFATRDANLATIQGFHVIHQDMDTLYADCNTTYSGTIGRRMAFEIYCPGGSQGNGLEIRDNIVDQQTEVMPAGDTSKKWHRAHIYMQGCGYATVDGNRLEGAVYYGFHAIGGGGHMTVTNNIIRADNDTPLVFSNMAYGIYTNGNDGHVFRGNYIYRYGTNRSDVSAAFRIRDSVGPDTTVVTDNVILGYRHCVYFQDIVNTSPGGVSFNNNTCMDDGVTGTRGKGAFHWGGAHMTVYNNIISGFDFIGRGGSPANVRLGNNLLAGYSRLYDASADGVNVTSDGGDVCHSDAACGATTNISQCAANSTQDSCDPTPDFMSSGAKPDPYYRLGANSPAIDRGANAVCAHSISGSACDIGAYEFVPAGDPPSNVINLRRTDTWPGS